jgi:hypothetical protein
MDEYGYVKNRKGICMAMTMEAFEELIEPHVPKAKAEQFKAIYRKKLNRFENEICELLGMKRTGQRLNAHAQSIEDGLFPNGRPRVVPPASETRRGK